MSESRKMFLEGVRAEIPLLIGVFPFGMIYGALALNAGLSASAAQLMSSIVFAGSSQFVTAQLVHDAAPGFVIIFTIAVVNLRHMLYSASLAPYLQDLSLRWKVLLSYLLTDEAYAPSIIKYEKEGVQPFSHWFVLGAGFSLWFNWQVSTALGNFPGRCHSRKSGRLILRSPSPLLQWWFPFSRIVPWLLRQFQQGWLRYSHTVCLIGLGSSWPH